MFTGIIEDLGRVKAFEKKQNHRLDIESSIFKDQRQGQSIAVNGACLTIADLKNNLASFDIILETIKKTNLDNLKRGDRVNLERALRVGDRLAGHFVTGHIDCVGRIIEKVSDTLKIKIPKENMKFIVPKGSVALDGISLTVADNIGTDNFTVYLIPHTIENTNLRFKKITDTLNIEFDLLGKYALKNLRPAITEDFLRGHGFS